MKLFFLTAVFFLFTSVNAQIINFPDANFKAKLISLGVDTNFDGNIQQSEALVKTFISIDESSITDLTGISAFSNLTRLSIDGNNISNLTSLNGLVNLTSLSFNNSHTTTLIGVNNVPNLQDLSISSNPLTSLVGILNFPNLVSFSCYGCQQLTAASDITSLSHLERLDVSYSSFPIAILNSMTNLKGLQCRGFHSLNSLDNFSNLTNLTSLNVGNNSNLTNLYLIYFPHLTDLYCDQNNIDYLYLNEAPNLTTLNCSQNNLESLNLTALTNLQNLSCGENRLTYLNLNGLSNLGSLSCQNNHIATINITGLPLLTYINLSGNNLTTVDASNQSHLNSIICNNMPNLVSAFLKNGSSYSSFTPFGFTNCPNLTYVCVDDARIATVQFMTPASCNVNSYCSFTPGGTFYRIKGNNHFDNDNNGCDITDINYPNLKLTFSNGAQNSSFFADAEGNYHYDVTAGNHTIVPTIENSNYFNVTPTTSNVSFPTVTSPYIKDFCITANGNHNDLEVSVLPLNSARSGFDAKYKIMYKNKGTAVQSGSLSLTFDDGKIDLVSAFPTASNQAVSNLNWNFNNLLPFETREISVTFNINSPIETPAVNSGDILNYAATIIGLTDETPTDNTSNFNQTVVNSFDPNDKTCLEGNTVTPEMIGKEVHYMIRFENTGTANAENIVVKDMIDTTKFDIGSLIPLDGSHAFTTKISNTNKVEFIFENINLPFDDAHNDGYVMFKIKTKPTLLLGNTFSNTASIYFDYNFPIITNTATTAIALLANPDFAFDNYFAIHPNPANTILNIDSKQGIAVTSYTIYNTLGQLVLVIPNAQQVKTIDVSELKTGHYFLKVNADKGTTTIKFIKQ